MQYACRAIFTSGFSVKSLPPGRSPGRSISRKTFANFGINPLRHGRYEANLASFEKETSRRNFQAIS